MIVIFMNVLTLVISK